MPGIIGIIGKGPAAEREAAIQQMTQALMHEPFYCSGYYGNEKNGIWVGCVCDKASFSKRMPTWNENRDICLIFSGDDFRAPEESAALRTRGHEFEARTTDYLVHLYEELGEKFIEKLNGRFSGVVIDLRVPSAVLFNDRYGLNRVYYHEREDSLYFSSEAKALLKVLPELRKLDLASLGDFFSCNCVLQNRTLFTGISLMPAGSAWKYHPGQAVQKTLYFFPQSWEDQEPLESSDYYGKLKETWFNILPRYFQDPGQMAMSLTGGKDSRMIMAWAHLPPYSLPCYTFGGLYRDCRDVVLARRIAQTCQQPHQVIALDERFLKEFPNLAEKSIYLTDGTMDVTGAAELYINRIAREIAPVRLTGNYGQEILFRSVAFKPIALTEGIFQKEFRGHLENASRVYFHELAGNRLSFVAFKQVPWFHYSRQALELSQVIVRSPFLDNNLVALAFRMPLELINRIDLQLRLISEGNPALGKIMTDQGLLLNPKTVMTKFFNLYQEYTFKAEYAYDGGMPQWLAKLDHSLKVLRLERLFLGRHKFCHYRVWFRDQLSGYVREILLDSRTRNRAYLDGPQLERIVKAHIKGIANYTAEIHRLLTAELVHRQFLD